MPPELFSATDPQGSDFEGSSATLVFAGTHGSPRSTHQDIHLPGTAVPQVRVGDWRKRTLDVTMAALALALLLPLMLMIGALIKLFSPGPALYGHERVGRNGRAFKCLKFRTMVVNGDDVLRDHLAGSEEARREWETTRKLRKDPRITPLGHVLRKSSTDELPQLINILRGEMSIVGPRPVVHDELRYYGDNASYYLASRPGLTGLWQVSGRNLTSYEARVAYDRAYCESWSLRMDLLLIARTIPVVISRQGTY